MKRIFILLTLCIALSGCAQATVPESMPDSTFKSQSETVTKKTITTEQADSTEPTSTKPTITDPLPTVPEPLETNIDKEDCLPIISQIKSLADEYGLSISYISCNSGYYFTVNGSTRFHSASTIKAIYCQYLLSAGIDLKQTILFGELLDRTSSSGVFTAENLGNEYTVRELMEYTIKDSDNTSYRLLFNTFGYRGFNEWVSSLGIPGLAFTSSEEFTEVSARDLSLGMAEVYRYGLHDSTLIDMLKAAKFKQQIALGTNHEVASKYGYNGGTMGFHDTAIVYASEPYALTILSSIYPYAEYAIQPFINVTKLTDSLNELLNE